MVAYAGTLLVQVPSRLITAIPVAWLDKGFGSGKVVAVLGKITSQCFNLGLISVYVISPIVIGSAAVPAPSILLAWTLAPPNDKLKLVS